jgi:hypothetical protein
MYGIEDVRRLNDMVAALGRFHFRVVVAGHVEPVVSNRGTHEVVIKEVGVYVRDSFDFEGFQPLGFWWYSPPYASALERGDVGVPLFNSTYREWRSANGEGGDFLVFSDLKRVPLNPPSRFFIG